VGTVYSYSMLKFMLQATAKDSNNLVFVMFKVTKLFSRYKFHIITFPSDYRVWYCSFTVFAAI